MSLREGLKIGKMLTAMMLTDMASSTCKESRQGQVRQSQGSLNEYPHFYNRYPRHQGRSEALLDLLLLLQTRRKERNELPAGKFRQGH
jgi:hypothetical protein